ncbi:hypothetical protein ACFX15_029567 [Malus domestica]
MAELAFPLASRLIGRLGSIASEETCLALGVKADLQKLGRTMSTIKDVLVTVVQPERQGVKLIFSMMAIGGASTGKRWSKGILIQGGNFLHINISYFQFYGSHYMQREAGCSLCIVSYMLILTINEVIGLHLSQPS